MEKILTEVFGIWYLIGAAFVFFMQAGFAMVEAGFTRAKNAGNIIMKNLMDFCLGTVAFLIIGYSLLMGQDFAGLVGWGESPLTDFAGTNWSSFTFNLVFCATAATIVSGAMAERTKFISYCIYSFVISLIVYPIEAHWVWGSGWLSSLGFHDFAGSAAIHYVGGLTALIGAWMFHLMVWLVWIQWCSGYKWYSVSYNLCDNYSSTCRCDMYSYVDYLDQIWKTRCCDVFKWFIGRFSCDYCGM